MKRILVTGGFGFLGSAIAKRLVADGHQVTVLDDGSRGARSRLGDASQFAVQKADVRRIHFGAKFDSVWHLAAVNGTKNFYKDPYRVLDVQLGGTLRIARECREHGVGELVLFSSSEVYHDAKEIPTDEKVPLTVPDALNPRYSYAGSKIASELLALHSGIERVLVLRPHNVYGPDMGFDHAIPEIALKFAHGDFTLNGGRETTRAYTHVSDFVAGAMVAWEKGEKRGIYHVGSEAEVPLVALAAELARLIDQPDRSPGKQPFEWREGRPGEPSRRCPNTKKLRALGWSPLVPIHEGLAEYVEWLFANRDAWPEETA